MKNIFGLFIGIILFSGSIYSCSTDPSYKRQSVKTIVLHKVEEDKFHKGRHTGYDYVLLLQKDSIRFDLEVTLGTFYEAEVGKVLYFDLCPRQMGQGSDTRSIISFFGGVLGFIVAVGFLFAILYKEDDEDKNKPSGGGLSPMDSHGFVRTAAIISVLGR